MAHPVSQGNDPEKLRAISDALASQARSLEHVGPQGRTMLTILEDAWSGPDLESYTGEWQSVGTMTQQTAQALDAWARRAREQADEQARISERRTGGGGDGGQRAPRPTDPFAGLKLSATSQATGGFSFPDLPSWGDVRDTAGNIFDDAKGLWDKGVNQVDKLTDQANQWWKDNIEESWLARQAQLRLSQGAALIDDFVDYAYNTDCPFMPVIGFAASMLGDTLDFTSKLINDPKGTIVDAWESSGFFGKVVTVASVALPLARLLKKPAGKLDDWVRKLFKTDPPKWKGDFTEKASKKNSTDPHERSQGRLNERANDYVNRYGLTEPEDVWDTSKIDPRRRGIVVEAAQGGNLPGSYKTWDKVEETADGRKVATSIKSIDPDAASYGKSGAVESRLKSYVDDIDNATPQNRGGVNIDPDDLDGKQLEVITPPGGFSASQLEELNRVRTYADSKGVDVVVKEYP